MLEERGEELLCFVVNTAAKCLRLAMLSIACAMVLSNCVGSEYYLNSELRKIIFNSQLIYCLFS